MSAPVAFDDVLEVLLLLDHSHGARQYAEEAAKTAKVVIEDHATGLIEAQGATGANTGTGGIITMAAQHWCRDPDGRFHEYPPLGPRILGDGLIQAATLGMGDCAG